MKTLIILRHAKAEVSHSAGDHSRELTARGRSDAKRVAHSMVDQGLQPEVFISSTAARAVQTARIVSAVFQDTPEEILLPDLYLADVEELLNAVHEIDNEFGTAVLVGHNPGLLDLINVLLDDELDREKLPTSAYAVVESDGKTWSSIMHGAVKVSQSSLPELRAKHRSLAIDGALIVTRVVTDRSLAIHGA